ncbi:HYR domain-containing protein [Maribacter chungangensis]|uniref:HYR domain-containing protein n=1 Tax=Maribacter chungangensis TaxID=1069117 RepID=A0ABW3B1B9_9FLAO
MKKPLLFLLPFLFCFQLSNAQIPQFVFEYDAAAQGNPALVTAVEHAFDIWSNEIVSSVPIVVQVNYVNLGFFTAGNAQTENFQFGFQGAPDPNVKYPMALANEFAQTDLNGTAPEIIMNLNSTTNFYYGTDGNPPSNQFDLVSVVLHEACHALGFFSEARVNAAGEGEFAGVLPYIYDTFLVDANGNRLIDLPENTLQLGNALTSGQVFMDGENAKAALGGARPQISANNFTLGSSLSHWNLTTYLGTDNSLMTPATFNGSAQHNVGDITKGLMADMGWVLATDNNSMAETEIILDGNGQLIITDTNGGTSDDEFVLAISGQNLRIQNNSSLAITGNGTQQIDANTVEVPLANITNGIEINGADGIDTLHIDSALNLTGAGNDLTVRDADIFITGTGNLRLNALNVYAADFDTGNLTTTVTTTANFFEDSGIVGTGTILGILNMQMFSTVAPGASPGILNTGNLILGAESAYEVEYDEMALGIKQDQINVTGTVTIENDVLLDLNGDFPSNAANELIIIQNDGSDPVVGTFQGLAEGAIINDDFVGTISYVGGDGNDITLSSLDDTPPTLVEFTPVDNAINIPLDANLILTFDEPVQLSGEQFLDFNILNVTDGRVEANKFYLDITVNGNVVTVNPMRNLSPNKEYSIGFQENFFQDLSGNAVPEYDGYNSPYNFSTITTADATQPTLSSISPEDNAIDVALNTVITLAFDEAIQVQQDPGVFRLFKILGTGTPEPSDIETLEDLPANGPGITINGNNVELDFVTDFEPNTKYLIQLAFDDTVLEDISGNRWYADLETEFESPGLENLGYIFTTGAAIDDTEAPVITCPATVTSTAGSNCSATVSLNEPTATDNLSTVFTFEGIRSDGFALTDSFFIGNTTVTWTATDQAGNISESCEQTVTISGTANCWENVGEPLLSDGKATGMDFAKSPLGNLYLAYISGETAKQLKVKMYDGTTWQAVGDVIYEYTQNFPINLAVDTTGVPYVAYYDWVLRRHIVKRYLNGVWEDFGGVIQGFAQEFLDPDIAFNTLNELHIVYGASGGGLTTEKWTGTAWEPVGPENFSNNTLDYSYTFDSNGVIYVAYQEVDESPQRLTVQRFINGVWEFVGSERFSQGTSGYSTISISPNNVPYVAYFDSGGTNVVLVKRFNGTSWEDVGDSPYSGGAESISLGFDVNGTPYIGFKVFNAGYFVKRLESGSWVSIGGGNSIVPLGEYDFFETMHICMDNTDSNNPTLFAAMAREGIHVKSIQPGVLDAEAPVINCPDNVAAVIAETETTATISLENPTATDNVSTNFTFSGSRSDALPLADPYPIGETTVTWTATDEAGNASESCDQLVTVLPAESEVVLAADGSLSLTDTNGGTSDDEFVMTLENGNLILTNNSPIAIAGMGVVQLDANTVQIPLSSITNGFSLDAGLGDDTLQLSTELVLLGPDNGITVNSLDVLLTGTGILELHALNVTDGNYDTNGLETNVETEANFYENATLSGTGSINGIVNMNANSNLDPGTSPGILNTGDLTLDNNNNNFEVNGPEAGTDHDQVVVAGTIIIAPGTTLNLLNGYESGQNDEIVLIVNDGLDAIVGFFDNFIEGAIVVFGDFTGTITYVGGDGNDLVLLGSTVTDTEPPMAVCQDFTVELDGNGTATVSVSDIDNGSSDNEGIAAIGIRRNVARDYDQNVVPDAIFGSGNANGGFTVNQTGEVELGLRAKVRYPVPQNTFNGNGDGTYSHLAGAGSPASRALWNFEWSVNTDPAGTTGTKLDGLTYEMGMDFDPSMGTAYFVFDPINAQPLADHAIGDNATANGGGTVATDAAGYAALLAANNVAQNSWNLDFFNEFVPTAFDPVVDGTYDIYLKAMDGTGAVVGETHITVVVGNGGGAGALPTTLDFTEADLGANTVELTVVDEAGNVSTCTATVTVESTADTEPPMAVCQDFTVELDGSGTATVSVSDIDNGSSDNNAIAAIGIRRNVARDYDQNVVPDAIFGSGNANGGFAVNQTGDVELGLRAKVRYPVPQNTFNGNGDGTYSHLAGAGNPASRALWNFEWSVNTDPAGTTGTKLDGLTYELGMDFDPSMGTAYFVFDPINAQPLADHAIGDNATANGGGTVATDAAGYAALLAANNVAQNSWNLDFFDELAGKNFDPTVNGTYEVYLKAFDGSGALVGETKITVIVGNGGAPGLLPQSIDFTDADIGTNVVELTVVDAAGNSTSCTSTVTVLPAVCPIAIQTEPTNFELCAGTEGATFSVSATGQGNLAYTWQMLEVGATVWTNAEEVEGTEQLTLLETIQNDRNGTQYRVIIRDDNGSPDDESDDCEIISNTATLGVSPTPNVGFTALPNVSIDAGVQLNLGGGIPSLDDQTSGSGVYSGEGVSDNGDGTYDFDPAIAGLGIHTISYTYTNETGCIGVASDDVEVLETCTLIIAEGPKGFQVCSGTRDQAITVKATGVGILSYNWEYTKNGSPWSKVDFSDGTETLHFPLLVPHYNGKKYRVRITSDNGTADDSTDDCTVLSQEAMVQVFDTPSLTFNTLGDVGVDAGVQKGLSGGNLSGGTFSGPGVTDNGNGTYDFDPEKAGIGTHLITYSYTNDTGCTVSKTDKVNVLEACDISFSKQPTDISTCLGATGEQVSVSVNGQGPFTYQWEYSIDDGHSWYNYGGIASNPVLSLPTMIPHFNGKRLRVVVNSGSCTRISQEAVIRFKEPTNVIFNAPATDLAMAAGTQTGLSGGLPSGGHYSGNGVTDNGNGTYNFNPIVAGSGVHAITYTYPGDNTSCGGEAIDTLTVTNDCSIEITENPADVTLCGTENESYMFNVSATGNGGITYQWQYLEGSAWVNSTENQSDYGSHQLVMESTQGVSAPMSYRVVVTSDNGTPQNKGDDCTVTSTVATLTYKEPLNISVSGANKFCEGDSTVITAIGGDTYEWKGPQGYLGTTGEITLNTPGIYTVTGWDSNSCAKGEYSFVVSVDMLPEVSFQSPDMFKVGAGMQIGLTGGLPLGGTYSGTGVTDDGNGQTYSFDPAEVGLGVHTITYTYEDGNSCFNSVSSTVNITNSCDIVIIEGPEDIVLCEGNEEAAFSVSASGNGVLSFLWETSIDDGGSWSTVATNATELVLETPLNGQLVRVSVADDDSSFGNSSDDCTVISRIAEVEVNELPAVSLNLPGTLTLDSGIILLESGMPQGGSYSGIGVLNNDDGTFSFDPQLATVGAYTITYTFSNDLGCMANASVEIEVTDPITPQVVLINEFSPNPPGNDSANQELELKGTPGETFNGWVVLLDSDSETSGDVNESHEIFGTFDEDGLMVVSINDFENPSFTLVLTDSFDVTVTDFDKDDNGQIDPADSAKLGAIFDALGIPDSSSDETYLFGAQLGGMDFKYTGREPELVFRERDTNDWYAVNDLDGAFVHDSAGNELGFGQFSTNPGIPTLGDINPFVIISTSAFTMKAWPNPVSEMLSLDLSNKDIIKTFNFMDSSGKLINSIPANDTKTQTFFVNTLQSGIYMVNAVGFNGESYTLKFIVRR